MEEAMKDLKCLGFNYRWTISNGGSTNIQIHYSEQPLIQLKSKRLT